jgi:hypothetical protein
VSNFSFCPIQTPNMASIDFVISSLISMSAPSGLYQTKGQVMENVVRVLEQFAKRQNVTDSLAAAYDVLRRTPPVLASTEYDVLRHECLVLNAVVGRSSG